MKLQIDFLGWHHKFKRDIWLYYLFTGSIDYVMLRKSKRTLKLEGEGEELS